MRKASDQVASSAPPILASAARADLVAPPAAVALDPTPIPAALRERPQWVVWKYILREGKWTKVPFNARTGEPASATDPSTWSTFDEAVAACRSDDGYAGIGFAFSEDDPFAGIDLDDCIDENGNLVPTAREIVDQFNSCTEVSPSGKGVKIFICGVKPEGSGCRSKKIDGFKETEIYDRERYFTVTGQHLSGTPVSIEPRQAELEALCERLWPTRSRGDSPPDTPPATPVELDDANLIERASNAKNGSKFRRLWAGDTSTHGGDDSAADVALCCMLAFWTGGDGNRMDALFRQSGLYREKWDKRRGNTTYGQRTIEFAIAGTKDFYGPGKGSDASPDTNSEPPSDGRPLIFLSAREDLSIDEAVEALRAEDNLYHRGCKLVRVVREPRRRQPSGRRSARVRRPEGAAFIQLMPAESLRERLAHRARIVQCNAKGEWVNAHPTPWLVSGTMARAVWPGLRSLCGISHTPILRPDGTIHQEPGYDSETGVLFLPEPGVSFPPIHPDVAYDEADVARDELLEVVCDFPFASDAHRAAWLASLLTPLARHAFDGPAPLFAVDSNIRGSGKTLLVQATSLIAMGRPVSVSAYAHDIAEMQKRITAIAIAGDPIVLLDNLSGTFGNAALDRALTCDRWQDRMLGRNENVDLPLQTIWFASGNNIILAADTARRVIHIRLDCLEDAPEERGGFKHSDLLVWVAEHRPRLVVAGLTILRAFFNAGCPQSEVPPFGSYEGWSHIVRHAVIWVSLPDPCQTRAALAETSDSTVDGLRQFIAACIACDPQQNGWTAAGLLGRLYPPHRDQMPTDAASIELRGAIEAFVACPAGKTPTSHSLARRLTAMRRRPVSGRYIDMVPNTPKGSAARWRVVTP